MAAIIDGSERVSKQPQGDADCLVAVGLPQGAVADKETRFEAFTVIACGGKEVRFAERNEIAAATTRTFRGTKDARASHAVVPQGPKVAAPGTRWALIQARELAMKWQRQRPAHLARTAGRQALHEWFQRETVKTASVCTLSGMQTLTERYRRALRRRVPWMPAHRRGSRCCSITCAGGVQPQMAVGMTKGAGQVA